MRLSDFLILITTLQMPYPLSTCGDISSLQDGTERSRELQAFRVGAAQFRFNFSGVQFSFPLAEQECPVEFEALLPCIIDQCPEFLDVCPSEGEVPENCGPPVAPWNETTKPQTVLKPTCKEVDQAFCEAFGTVEECFLVDSIVELFPVLVCVFERATGANLSSCTVSKAPCIEPLVEEDQPVDLPMEEEQPMDSSVAVTKILSNLAGFLAAILLV